MGLKGKQIYQNDHTVIYQSADEKTGKLLAVKILEDEFPDMTHVARFNEEYEITHNLNIKGVRRAIAKDKIDNHHALTLEYIKGISIEHILEEKQKIATLEFLPLASQICEILQEVHLKGIIHKDLNPRNILIDTKNYPHIIDFGIATKIYKRAERFQNAKTLEGTLPYLSPEQTGRMNRSLDYRSDLYSLGATFYEILTGRPPFLGNDAMALVHAHIVKTPKPLTELQPEIPEVLSQIVLRLLAKNAEDRYQSAYGIKADLDKCLEYLRQGVVPDFKLGQEDVSDKFHIPEKLYGRDKEAKQLTDTFNRVSQGSAELLLVAGYSGIGKTSLISELHKPLTEARGHFIKAKFDQFSREIPYSAIITALQDFVKQLLSEDEKLISEYWKPLMQNAVGENGKVLTEVIPKLKVIIGEQPDLQEIDGNARKERFNQTFLSFMQVISSQKHPLILFIDDWQWADLGSLEMLSLLMSSQNQYFLILGAYRDNEVSDEHPFIQTVKEIEKKNRNIQTIKLLPLKKEDCFQIIEDTLGSTPERISPLNESIYQKTNGNPFFFRQFFKTLHDERLIAFNFEKRKWDWDIQQIDSQNMTDNVVELMANRVRKLPESTQKALQISACIGNEFDLKMLAYLLEDEELKILKQVFRSVGERLITPLGDNYKTAKDIEDKSEIRFKFVHDRIQQASYSLLPEKDQKQTALEIGRYLHQSTNQEDRDEKICDIVNYYNVAKELITDKNERELLVQLNYQAGEKTARSSAFASTLEYFIEGISYLDENSWTENYEMSYQIHLKKAEYEYFNNLHEQAEKSFKFLLEKAKTNLEKARVYKIYTFQLSNTGRVNDAIEKGTIGLKLLDIEIPENPQEQMALIQQIVKESIQFVMQKGQKGILEMPHTDDERVLLIGDICRGIIAIALYTPLLQGVLATIMSKLSLEGNNKNSAYSYGMIATILARQKAFQPSFMFVDITLALADKYNDPNISSPVLTGIVYLCMFWRDSFHKCLDIAERGYKMSLDCGNYETLGYSSLSFNAMSVVSGSKLDDLVPMMQQKINILEKRKLMLYLPMAQMFRNWAINLQGKTESQISITTDDFSEEKLLTETEKLGDAGQKTYSYYAVVKLHIMFTFGKYKESLPVIEKGLTTYAISNNTSFSPYFPLYTSLIYAKIYDEATEENQVKYKSYIREQIQFFTERTEDCPENFTNKHLLLSAELARLENDTDKAMDFYDQAIETALQNEFIHEVALANELAGHFYLGKNKTQIAKIYVQQAHYYYKIWGAWAKVKQLTEIYPRMLMRETRQSTTQNTMYSSTNMATGSTVLGASNLDVLSVIKSAQAISGEIKLETLLQKMMRAIVENAGADRGVLMLNEQGKLIIQAEYGVDTDLMEVMQNVPITEVEDLPLDIINYVFRTKEVVLLHDASHQEQFRHSPYIIEYQPNSVLCTPVVKQGDLKAVIYLENEGTIGAFSEDRQLIVNMLTSQVAVSIDNAILYENLEERVNQRTKELYQAFEKIEKQHTHITASINYARRIQEAIMPLSEKISQSIPEHFIFFKPKDVVSGDFYWFAERDGKVMISAVDCTGHGVPGAFMSMIGDSLLNQIVHDHKITTSGYILTALNQGIQKSLKQATTNNQDGMDIALCVIDKAHEKLEFSGAKNPLLYIPKDVENYQLIRGDKWSIGGSHRDKNTFIYETHEIKLTNDPISFYIYTDGYQDQFGGKRNIKKFLSRHFRRLLFENHTLPMEEQRQVLENMINKWKGKHKQVDDMLVIGFKI